jgi:hypothetical protein
MGSVFVISFIKHSSLGSLAEAELTKWTINIWMEG